MRDIFGKEFHLYNEIFLFLEGEAEFICDHFKQKLMPYTLIIIPKESFHQFYVTGSDNDYQRCVLNFNAVNGLDDLIKSTITKTELISNINSETVYLFKKLIYTAEKNSENDDCKTMLKAVFAQVLLNIKYDLQPTAIDDSSHINPIVSQAIDYIDKNILNIITLSTVADYLHISVSYLSHEFKKNLHISPYQYILKKKLTAANRKIKNSTPPMQAAMQCGFNDYSGFYKAYKKLFNTAPSEKDLNTKY